MPPSVRFNLGPLERQKNQIVFPLFTPMLRSSVNHDAKIYLCLYQSLGVLSTMCGNQAQTFSDMIEHQREHDICLQPGVDYCSDCQLVFSEKMEAVDHYLTHTLNLKNRELLSEAQHPLRLDVNDFLESHFEKWQKMKEDILNMLLFGFPYEQSQKMEKEGNKTIPIILSKREGKELSLDSSKLDWSKQIVEEDCACPPSSPSREVDQEMRNSFDLEDDL